MSKLSDLKLKICGLRDNIQDVIALQPDLAGFIFYGRSPRCVCGHLTAEELREIPPSVKKVGVFVNQTLGEVISTAKEFDLQYVQLHGDETVGYCKRINAEGLAVIKVFAGNVEHSPADLRRFSPYIDLYLFDTRLEKYGGTGKSFDWNNLANLDLQKPVILSGGISLEHLQKIESIEGVTLYGIDVNSKFEIKPGLKDIALLKQLKNSMQSLAVNTEK